MSELELKEERARQPETTGQAHQRSASGKLVTMLASIASVAAIVGTMYGMTSGIRDHADKAATAATNAAVLAATTANTTAITLADHEKRIKATEGDVSDIKTTQSALKQEVDDIHESILPDVPLAGKRIRG